MAKFIYLNTRKRTAGTIIRSDMWFDDAEAGMLSISQTWPKSTLYARHHTPTQVTSAPATPAGREASIFSPEIAAVNKWHKWGDFSRLDNNVHMLLDKAKRWKSSRSWSFNFIVFQNKSLYKEKFHGINNIKIVNYESHHYKLWAGQCCRRGRGPAARHCRRSQVCLCSRVNSLQTLRWLETSSSQIMSSKIILFSIFDPIIVYPFIPIPDIIYFTLLLYKTGCSKI